MTSSGLTDPSTFAMTFLDMSFLNVLCKPAVIVISLTGLTMTLLSVLFFLKIYTVIDKPPYIPFITGLLIIAIFPASIFIMAKRNFRSDELLRERIRYTFTAHRIFLKGSSFDVNIGWDKIHKVRRLNNWLLFYHDRARVEFMIKNSLNIDEQKEFDRMVKLNTKS